MSLTIWVLNENATVPQKATPGSVGLDLHSSHDATIYPGQRVVISTGIAMTFPDGTYGRIAPRTGIAVKHGIDVFGGVIDPNGREVKVVLYNSDRNPYIIRKGYRVAQLILEKYHSEYVTIVEQPITE